MPLFSSDAGKRGLDFLLDADDQFPVRDDERLLGFDLRYEHAPHGIGSGGGTRRR